MAFSFANAGSSGFGGVTASSNAQTQTGPDLEEIHTEGLGFHSLAGEAKIRLLPSPWPSDALPPPTASLLSIASRKGLLAAAGPESVVIAATDSVRQAFSASDETENNIKPFTPQLSLEIGTRISQVAFSADEEFLVISAENGGGLAVYEVQALMQGTTTLAFQLATNNISLRAVVQNPTPEKAELLAVITTNGELMMANLKTRDFVSTSNSPVMKDGVSCVSWSFRGKQLVAGLADGTCHQMTPEGEGKAEIPRPPDIQGEHHVASISWLENDIFLIGYTPTVCDDGLPPTTFYIVTRQVKGPYIYQKLPEACPPFGINRSPPHFFMQRLKGFPPNLQDVIVVASTTSADIGLFTRAKTPLVTESASDNIINVFTTTVMAIDSRRAQLPMSESMEDTSPIGTVIDLSAKEKVLRPLPGEEMDSSPGPVPALMVLNNEGILSAWWIIYADSIRQGTSFPGLVSEGIQAPSQSQNSSQPTTFGNTISQAAPVFGQTDPKAPTNTSFGAPSQPASIFGGGSSVGATASGAFGAPSAPGSSPSPWTSSGFTNTNSQNAVSSFGKPSFGNSSTVGTSSLGPAFGAAGGIGKSASPWGTAVSGAPNTGGSVFGQSGGLGMRGPVLGASTTSGMFGSGSSTEQSQGGFAGFAKGSGFLAAPSQGESKSAFATARIGPPPSSSMDTEMPFGGIPQKSEDAPKGLLSTSGFTLGSSFTGDGSDVKESSNAMDNTKGSLFGDGFRNALGEVQKDAPAARSKEATMTEDDSDMAGSESSEELPERGAQTPMAKDVQPQIQVPTTNTPKTGGMFGTQSQSTTTPAAVQSSVPTPSIFGKQAPQTTTPAETPQKPVKSPHDSQTPPSPSIKPEPEDQETPTGVSRSIPEAPLPPESTSKVSYAPGDSSSSSKSSAEDAPPPPDWFPSKTKLRSVEQPPEDSEESADDGDAPLPPDFLPSKVKSIASESEAEQEPELPSDDEDDGLDDEGSGVDVAQEITPTSDPRESPRITPSSSFGPSLGPSPIGGVFSKVQQPRQHVKSLFGEVSQQDVPLLPPPSRAQESPRSPSPVRLMPPGGGPRPDNARSISAPMQPQPRNYTAQHRSALPSNKMSVSNAQEQRHKDKHAVRAAQQARQQAEEEQDLSDKEDEKVREELENEVEATKTLDDFLAHQDYIGTVTKPGIPGQIEKVYRDVNSMVDTLGLNARALEGFVKGHEILAKDGDRSIEDLADADWCLVEIDDLVALEDQVEDRLSKGRLEDVQGKLDACRDLRNGLAKLKKRRAEVRRTIEAIPGEVETNALKLAPLATDQSSKQNEMRKNYTKVQKLIADAEENLTMLRARLASLDPSEGRTPTTKKPTVEAVTRTINKMTSMVEKRSGDIDFLEAQMRKLRFTPVNQDSSREGSPSAAGSTTAKMPLVKTLQGPVSGLIESPSSNLRRSIGDGGTPRRRLSGITPQEVTRHRAKVQRRREVNEIMREAFAKAGPRVRTLE